MILKNPKIVSWSQNIIFGLLGVYIIYNFIRSYSTAFVIEVGLSFILVVLFIYLVLKPLLKNISKKEFAVNIKIFWLIFIFLLLNIIISSVVALLSEDTTFLSWSLLILSLLWKILGTLFIVLIATAIGLMLLKKIKANFLPEAMEFFFGFGIGMGILGFCSFFLAVAQKSNLYSSLALLALGSVLSFKEILNILQKIKQKNIEVKVNLENHWLILFWFLLLVLLEIAFLCSLTNIFAADWDSFHQYLTFPMEYLQHGGLKQFLWHPGWGYPQLGEMLFLFAATLFGVTGPFLLNYIFFIFLIVATFYFTNNVHLKNLQPYIVSFLISAPFIARLAFTHTKIDLIYFFYCLLIFIILKKILDDDEKITLKNNKLNILLAIILGLILSFKYISLFTTVSIFLALFILSKEKIKFLKKSFFISLFAFCIMSPWLIKNLIVYHSPLYPLLPGQDATFMATGKMCARFFQESAAHDMPLLYASLIEQTGIKIFDNLHMFGTAITRLINAESLRFVGMLFMALFPLILLYAFQWKKISTYSKFLLTFTLIFFFFWLIFMIGAIWYFFPGLLALLLFISMNLEVNKLKSLSKILIITTAFLGLTVIFQNTPNLKQLQYANRDLSSPEYVFTKGDWPEANNYINNLLNSNSDSRIYSFMDPRGYFIHNSSEKFILDYYGEKFNCLNEGDNVKEDLKKLGAKYILFYKLKKLDCKILPDPNINKICETLYDFEDFLQKENLPIIYENSSYTIYAL